MIALVKHQARIVEHHMNEVPTENEPTIRFADNFIWVRITDPDLIIGALAAQFGGDREKAKDFQFQKWICEGAKGCRARVDHGTRVHTLRIDYDSEAMWALIRYLLKKFGLPESQTVELLTGRLGLPSTEVRRRLTS